MVKGKILLAMALATLGVCSGTTISRPVGSSIATSTFAGGAAPAGTSQALAQPEGWQSKKLFMKDAGEKTEYIVSPPPPFRGAEWVERVLEVCEREIAEWEKTQEEGATETDEGGPYHAANHARSGVRSLNPALDLTASGTVERPWSKHRLAAYARQQGFDNVTSQNAEEWVEDQNLTSQLPRHYLEQQDWSDKHPGQTTDELSRGFQALKVHGTGYWGTNMSLDDEMDANVDPWFHSNQDTNTSLNVFQGHAVDPTLELHFRAKLSEFEEACTVAAKCHKARQRQVFATENAEEDQMMNEHVSLPASSVFENRKRTATLASNKWIDNEDMMPSKEWDPSLPRVMWTMRTQGINTLNQFALGDMGGEGAFVSPCLTGLSSWGRLAACPSRRAPAALGTRMSMEAQHQRRAMIRGGLSGVLAGVLGLRVGVARAEEAKPAGGAMVSSGNDKYGYKFEHPDTWKVSKKPVQTHMDEILVKRGGGTEVGVAVDPVKIESIVQFGTPKEVAARVIGVERKKDGVSGARLLASTSEERDGLAYYTIEYESKSSRGDKHFIACVTISGRKLYAMTAQAKIDKFEESEGELRAIVKSFRVSPPAKSPPA